MLGEKRVENLMWRTRPVGALSPVRVTCCVARIKDHVSALPAPAGCGIVVEFLPCVSFGPGLMGVLLGTLCLCERPCDRDVTKPNNKRAC